MPTMLGVRDTGRQSLHTTDYRVGAELLGEAAGTGAMFRVQEGIGKRFTGFA